MSQALQKCVVSIRSVKNQHIVGTGFVVDAQHILTCAHVVAAAGAAVGDTLRVGFAAGEMTRRVTVLETAWRDREREDIALLKLTRPLPEGVTPALLWHHDANQHPFASFGYVRLGDMQGIGAHGTIVTETTDKKGIPWLQLQSQQVDKGLSGAPILDLETDRVVGMLSLTSNKEEANRDTCFATPISAIRTIWPDLLLTPPEPEPDAAPSINVQISGSGTAVIGSGNTVIGAGSTVIGGDKHEHHYHLDADGPDYEAPPLPPKGTLADVGWLPPGSCPVHCRYPTFTGREAELLDLAALLLYGGNENAAIISQPAIASGMGGIGKSQLAVEFMYRYGRFFPGGVYWISFSDPDAIGTEIAACVGALPPAQQATFHNLDLPTQERLVRTAWQQPIPRLLIFDNLDDERAVPLLNAYRPKTGGCRLLVTSRRETWPSGLGVAVYPLHTLPRRDSIHLLRQLIGAEGDHADVLDEIADALGDLPLALHLAGSYLHRYRRSVTPAAYLHKLNDPDLLTHPSLTGKKAEFSPTGHELHVGKTFALSYERLDDAVSTDRLALALLARLAYFSPIQAVPLPLLTGSLRSGAFAETAPDETEVDDALERLRELGLIEPDEADGGAAAHRLIAAFVRSQPADGTPQADVEQAIRSKAIQLNKAGYPRELLPWQAHLRHVTDAAAARESEYAADLCNELGYHLRSLGDLAAARPFFERALAIYEKALGPDHPDTATSLNNLGALLDSMGDLAAARPYYERALAIREKALGPDHPNTASSLNNLGFLLQAMGDLAAARPYSERALAIREKALGPDHPDTAQSLNNLGVLHRAMGDLAAARPYLERALAINEKALGPDHPDTALSLNNLGYLLQAMGDLAAARPYYERALAIREKALGPDHPDTALSLNNLGFLLQAMGDLAAARPYYERALAIYEKALGPDHPDTARSLNNLGFLLQAMGDLAAARPYYERALAIYEKALGPDHPDTALSLNNLGVLLKAMGDLAAARPYYERALAIREKALGPDHPDTALSLNNLGFLLKAMGDLAAARPYYERALAIREKALGPDHPDTARSLNNLGGLLDSMGDLAAARPYYERALAIREKALGPDHPDTARSLNNLGGLLDSMGDLAAARPYYERALAIREKALGPDHPDLAYPLNNLGLLLQALGDLSGARDCLARALTLFENGLGPNHPNTQTVRTNLESLK